jgi:hypothetical protein
LESEEVTYHYSKIRRQFGLITDGALLMGRLRGGGGGVCSSIKIEDFLLVTDKRVPRLIINRVETPPVLSVRRMPLRDIAGMEYCHNRLTSWSWTLIVRSLGEIFKVIFTGFRNRQAKEIPKYLAVTRGIQVNGMGHA